MNHRFAAVRGRDRLYLANRLPPTLFLAFLIGAPVQARAQTVAPSAAGMSRTGWTQSYAAGGPDANGACAGGSEIMHLAAHKGKLYAANGYWQDARWTDRPYAQRQSAQVLRLDATNARWQVDLDLGQANARGLRFMKGHILQSITFTRNGLGKRLPHPRTLLVMAAGAYRNAEGVVVAWTRDDATGAWHHAIVQHGSRDGGTRWVPRDVAVYRDKVTGIERIFLLLGNPGIISGVYDDTLPSTIRWDQRVEFPASGTFKTRPLGIVKANGSLLFSVGGVIYRRIDGARPTYAPITRLGDDVNTDLGGIRGLTTIPNPNGAGESVLFLWVPRGRSVGQVKRLDPDGAGGYAVHDEQNLLDLMSRQLGCAVRGILGGYNSLYPVVHPETGETVHIIGFQGTLQDREELRWKGTRYYAGAMYAVRSADQTYTVQEVNGRYGPGKPVLVSPRTFARSPFGENQIFIGGHDANFHRSDDMAWIFKAPLDVALGPAAKH